MRRANWSPQRRPGTGRGSSSWTGRGCWASAASVRPALRCVSPGRRLRVTLAKLSPQELQVAQLAAQGLSNREIGLRLYLSHRTVGSHLNRVYPKLGVHTRTELSAVLSDAVPAG